MKRRAEIRDIKGNILIPFGEKGHICSVCDHIGIWDSNWEWYGSYKDMDDDNSIIKTCSKSCRIKLNKK